MTLPPIGYLELLLMRIGWTARAGILTVAATCLLGSSVPAEDDSSGQAALEPLVQLLVLSDEPEFQLDILQGMHEALAGRRGAAMPAGWPQVARRLEQSRDPRIRDKARMLSVIFGDAEALAALRKIALDAAAPAAQRQAALEALAHKRLPDLLPVLHRLVEDPHLAGAALRGLAAYDDPRTPEVVLARYAKLSESHRRDAVGTLASRPEYARQLLSAVEHGAVPRGDISAFTARQLADLNDPKVTALLKRVWGEVRATSAAKAQRMAYYKQRLTPEALSRANLSRGRLLFARHCAACHVLFDAGQRTGPELTGGQRTNLDYVLSNVLDPSAVVARDYRVTIVETADGRIVSGIVRREDDSSLSLQTVHALVVIPKQEIEARMQTAQSMMPEGLLDKLSDEEVRDLVAYLASPAQVPLPPGESAEANALPGR